MPSVRRGQDNDPLLDCDVVKRSFRLENLEAENRVSPKVFELSGPDKEGKPPHLSTYCHALTTDLQMENLVPHQKPFGIADLSVRELRQIQIPEITGQTLDALWTQASDDPHHVVHTKPGVDGHAGIVFVGCDPLNKKDKSRRKIIRSQLANLATKVFRHYT